MIAQIVGIVLSVFVIILLTVFTIGAVVINLFDRERKEEYERQIQQTDSESDKQ